MDYIRTNKDYLDKVELLEIYKKYAMDSLPKYQKLKAYYLGENVLITNRKFKSAYSPHNNIPCPFARKLVRTVHGYMFRPGYITYGTKTEGDDERKYKPLNDLQYIFDTENEPQETADLGLNAAIYGKCFEMVYIGETEKKLTPKFVSITPEECFLIYNYDRKPKAVAGLVFYAISGTETRLEVYYPTVIEFWSMKVDENKELKLTKLDEKPNFFGEVPFIEVLNNNDGLGDIEPVIGLIDAHDVIVSDAMNEFDRFSQAYLLLAQRTLSKEDADRIKEIKIFDKLETTDAVKFLTKDINDTFIQNLKEDTRKLIYTLSQIPDFTDERFRGSLSGTAIKRMLWDFEYIAVQKESYMKTALRERIRMIDKIMRMTKTGDLGELSEFTISFKRNVSDDLRDIAETANLMTQTTSLETALGIYPADVVPNVQEELEKKKGDQEEYVDLDKEEEEVIENE